jgi:cobalt-zinc-cadmium resistance protein CzcA
VLVRRENGSRFALIQSNVSGRDLVGFVEEARAAVARDVPLPAGYRSNGAASSRTSSARGPPGLVVPVALALIFFVLFMTFGSVRQAVLILGNVPFAWSAAWRRCGCRGSTCRCPHRWASSPCWASPCSTGWCW